MLETVACQLAAEGQSSNGAVVWFLVLFALFVGVDSVVNAAALMRTLKLWENALPPAAAAKPTSTAAGIPKSATVTIAGGA
jgi:hypothetical protein